MHKPVILIPASYNADQPPDKFHFNKAYIVAIEKAGGFPIGVMRPDESAVDEIFDTIDGLYLMGGNDIDPKEYGEEDKSCILCEPERDATEQLLIKKAMERNMPIFAICRGFQVLNVALGGSLYQDVLKDMPGAQMHSFHRDAENQPLPRNLLAHDVSINPNTALHMLSQKTQMGVNSLHHQGIKKLGERLIVSATAPDGLIEAIEIKDYPFGVAVEWHPEELHDDASHKLFSAFIEASRKYHETKNRN
ncbi:MAG: gamma-glutamyl-gamma-aminobutyrate hydrolase family protein [Candidatus Nitrotoga sp.]